MPGPMSNPNENIKWCHDCGRYYNPKSEHECVTKEIKANRESLETWLGRYKIREEGS